ncbi:MAG: T9SS type A sorting domain-containing protein, partial [Bacteroidota bacterium]
YQNDSVIILPGDTTILDIGLSESAMELQEIEIVEYAVPITTKSLTSSVGGVSVSQGNQPQPPPQPRKQLSYKNETAGLLTASELNDFSKWDLWKDIKDKELKYFQKLWNIYPENRYSVQVKNEDGRPVANATVVLKNRDGNVLWRAMTDNTGKAELWTNLFGKQYIHNPEIIVTTGSKDYTYQRPTLFQQGITGLKVPVPCSMSDQTDIAFVVDATESMSDEIGFLKSDVINIIRETKKNLPALNISLGSVFYRCYGNSYTTKMNQLSADVSGAVEFINKQEAKEGGDEVVEYALGVALDSLNWNPLARSRLLFLILDQPPLTTVWSIMKIQTCIEKAAEKGIRIIPVVASAETPDNAPSMEYLLRSTALATNGTYVFLTDHSHIGDAHAKPVTDTYDVELLNTLLKRIIYQFNYMPACDNKPVSADTTTFSNSPVIAHEIIDTSRHVKTIKPGVIVKDFTDVTGQDTTGKRIPNDTLTGNTAVDTLQPAVVKKIVIKFFPNPTTGRITVLINGNTSELYLTDITGKLLSKFKTNGLSKLDIDLGIYSTGIYFLKFFDNGKWFSGKVVLVH